MEQKSVKKQYINILIPTLIGMLSNSLYCLVDVYFISIGAGSVGLAALNIAMPIFTLYSAIGLLFGAGGATLISIAHGAKDKKLGNQSFTLSMVIMVVLGLVISVVGTIFVKEFAYLLGATSELIDPVVLYLRPLTITAMPFIVMYATSILLRSDHNPKLAMTAMMVGNLSNIVLDYVFVVVFHMGIEGASIATAISPVLTIVIASIHFLKKQNTVRFVKQFYDKAMLKRMVSSGMGSGIMELSAGAVILIFNAVILGIADAQALAAYAIITNIAYVMKGLLVGFAQSAQPMIASSYGAGDFEKAKEALRISIRYSIFFSSIVYLLFLCIPEIIASIFASNDNELIQLASRGIRIYFISLMFMAVNTGLMYYFQSIEQGRYSTLLAMLKGIVFVLIGIVVLVPFFQLDGIWCIVPLAEVLTMYVGFILYRKYTSNLYA